ncbi:MAG: ribonuclease III [Bacillota bacterium]
MKKTRVDDLITFIKENQITIKDHKLVDMAFTHPTYAFENKLKDLESNQRLEFLGDAVLGLIVGHYLYDAFPKEPEGVLTKMRAAVVCEGTLATVARRLRIGEYLKLGKGEELTGGRERNSNLADAFEALVGAIYLDNGIINARQFVLNNLVDEIERFEAGEHRDYKTMVQELCQKLYGDNVTYGIISETGPDHHKQFEAGLYFQGKLLTIGSGFSKKEAEQAAAKKAYSLFKK